MGFIHFDLTSTGSLHTMASPAAGFPGTLPPGMPATGGLYLIYNQINNNRYIGKAGNLSGRFDKRMLTVNELGLSAANLAGLGAFWGTATPFNTPVAIPPAVVPAANTLIAPVAPPALGFQVLRSNYGAPPPVPAALIGTPGGAINYGTPVVTTTIDGIAVNVEALLIRLFRQAAAVGGTITNLAYIGPFTNPTNRELIVQVEWGACGVVGVPWAHFCISIPAYGTF